MSNIDITVLKRLCADTSAGLVNCKKALVKADGDYDKARNYLRELGHSLAAKRLDREASDGVVGVFASNNFGVILELNCETDFVARNEKFQHFATNLIKHAHEKKINSKDELLSSKMSSGQSVEDEIKSQVGVFKENIQLSKFYTITLDKPGIVHYYIHNKYTDNLGKIGVLVSIESDASENNLREIAKNISIQIMSCDPKCIDVDDLDKKVLEEEKAKYEDSIKGKPANIAEKIINGKLKKFYSEFVLIHQEFCMDQDKTVAEYISECEKKLSAKIKVGSYKKFTLGIADE